MVTQMYPVCLFILYSNILTSFYLVKTLQVYAGILAIIVVSIYYTLFWNQM